MSSPTTERGWDAAEAPAVPVPPRPNHAAPPPTPGAEVNELII